MIGERTRVALAAKKAHGATLGNRTNLAEAQTIGAAANRTAADAFAANVLPVVRTLQASGTTATRAIAEALNARGIRAAGRLGESLPGSLKQAAPAVHDMCAFRRK